MRHKIVVHSRRSLAWLVLAASLGVLGPLQPWQPSSSATAAVSSAADAPVTPLDLCWGCGH